jgi:hypothetical protein
VLFGSIMGMAAIFPSRFTGAVMMGNGVAGIVVMVLRVITIFAFPSQLFASALSFFLLSAFVLIVCFVLFIVLLRLPITRGYDAEHKASKRSDRGDDVRSPLLDSSEQHSEEVIDAPTPTANNHAVNDEVDAQGNIRISIWSVFVAVKMPAICVFAVFLVTLTLFPSIMLFIKSTSSDASWSGEWFDIVMISTFMVGDWIGRSTPSFFMLIPAKYLWIVVAARFGFFPLFAWCVLKPYSDWLPISKNVVVRQH